MAECGQNPCRQYATVSFSANRDWGGSWLSPRWQCHHALDNNKDGNPVRAAYQNQIWLDSRKMGFNFHVLSEGSMVGMSGYQSPSERGRTVENKGPLCAR